MARNHAKLYCSVWHDPDWLDLDPWSHLLYIFLLSQPRPEGGNDLEFDLPSWASMLQMDPAEVYLCLLELEGAGWVEVGFTVRMLRVDRVGEVAGAPLTYTERERAKVTAAVRQAVMERDGHACRCCGSTERLAIDHVIALARGGTSDIDNLGVLCQPCNSRKATKPWDQFLKEHRAANP